MKLITKEVARRLMRGDSLGMDRRASDTEVAVKFFNPVGAQTWFIVSGTPLDDVNGRPLTPDKILDSGIEKAKDWHMFGWCDLGMGTPELGYVLLSQLTSLTLPLGLKIERDMYFDNKRLSEVMDSQGTWT
mgnify:CR=1 FL=1